MVRAFILRTRVNGLERRLIHDLAQSEGVNASEFIRLAIREAAILRGKLPGRRSENHEDHYKKKEVQNGS